jgi:hypothetical protein
MTKVLFQADADLKQAIVIGTIRREANKATGEYHVIPRTGPRRQSK